MRRFFALLALLATPALADPPTGNSGNGFGNFAGYQYACNTTGCTQAGMRFVVPKLKYDTDGPVSGRMGYIFAGINDPNTGGDLFQAGITLDSNGAGGFTFSAFWECFGAGTGNNNVQTAFDGAATLSVIAGDLIDTAVQCTNCTAGMAPPGSPTWTATVTDVTTSTTVTKTGYVCGVTNWFWSAFWVIELNNTNNINFGVLPFSVIKYNSANASLSQTVQAACAMGFGPCALYEYTAGGGNTGSTVNPSVPSGGNAFRLCSQNNGLTNSGGTTNFATCDATAGTPAGHGIGF